LNQAFPRLWRRHPHLVPTGRRSARRRTALCRCLHSFARSSERYLLPCSLPLSGAARLGHQDFASAMEITKPGARHPRASEGPKIRRDRRDLARYSRRTGNCLVGRYLPGSAERSVSAGVTTEEDRWYYLFFFRPGVEVLLSLARRGS